jgi:hypothetical protein
MLIVVGIFFTTFLAVCAIGYLPFLRSGRDSQTQRTSHSDGIEPAAGTRPFADLALRVKNGERQGAIEQQILHTIISIANAGPSLHRAVVFLPA